MLRPEEITAAVHEELYRWARLDGNDMSHDDASAFADQNLANALASHLSNAMLCMMLSEVFFDPEFKERAVKQLYNWG